VRSYFGIVTTCKVLCSTYRINRRCGSHPGIVHSARGERRTLLKLQRPAPDRELSRAPTSRQLSADELRDTVGLAFSKR